MWRTFKVVNSKLGCTEWAFFRPEPQRNKRVTEDLLQSGKLENVRTGNYGGASAVMVGTVLARFCKPAIFVGQLVLTRVSLILRILLSG